MFIYKQFLQMFLRFTIASIIAFVLSSYTNILIYQNIKKIKKPVLWEYMDKK